MKLDPQQWRPSEHTVLLATQTQIDVAVQQHDKPLTPVGFGAGRAVRRGPGIIDFHWTGLAPGAVVLRTVRLRDTFPERAALLIRIIARDAGVEDALVQIRGARVRFWDEDERYQEVRYGEISAAKPALYPRVLRWGQAIDLGAELMLTAGDAPTELPVEWFTRAEAGETLQIHPMLLQGLAVPSLWPARERGELQALGRDSLHAPISGAATNPGQTGGQRDFCSAPFAPGSRLHAETFDALRRSVWQEACRPHHWTEANGEIVTVDRHPTLVMWNGSPHLSSLDKLGLPKERWHGGGETTRSVRGEDWRSYDRQHFSINHLAGYFAVCDDPHAGVEIDQLVEVWLASHPVGSGTAADGPDSPRAGRALGAGVKLWLLTRDERLARRLLERAEHADHAQLVRNMTGVQSNPSERPDLDVWQIDVWESDVPEGAAKVLRPGQDLGELDPDLRGLRAIGGPVEKGWEILSVPPGPVFEVRGPEGHGLPKHPHWRPWEDAIRAYNAAHVADEIGSVHARFVADVLALHVVLNGYRESDWQIAHAMVWPVPADRTQLVHGDTVMWADGTDFRWWARPAVAYLRRRLLDLLDDDARTAATKGPQVLDDMRAAVRMHQPWHEVIVRCEQILASVPLPAPDKITLADLWKWQWRSVWD